MRAARAGTSSPALVALALLGCTALKPGTDVRRMDAGQGDAGRGDAGRVDASPPDAGADAATDDDAGRDAGGRDGGPPPAIEQLALGARHTCARDALGRVICWGDNRDGQLGRLPTTQLPPGFVPGFAHARDLCAGEAYTCAMVDEEVHCWGDNSLGTLGDGTEESSTSPVRVEGLPAGEALASLACGPDTACVVTSAGALYCWGDNSSTQIDLAGGSVVRTPLQVSTAPPEVHGPVDVGIVHTCAMLGGAELLGAYCWGANGMRQIDGSGASFVFPANAATVGGTSVVLLAVGPRHTCTYDGFITCWGEGPVPMSTPTGAPIVSGMAAGQDFTCAHSSDRVECFGRNDVGQLGTSNPGALRNEVPGVAPPVRSIDASRRHACVLDDLGILCWGSNDRGQIRPDHPEDQLAPTRIDLSALLREP